MVFVACVAGGIVSVRDESFGGGAVIQKREWDDAPFLAAYAIRDGFAAKSHSTATQYHQVRRLWCLMNYSYREVSIII